MKQRKTDATTSQDIQTFQSRNSTINCHMHWKRDTDICKQAQALFYQELEMSLSLVKDSPQLNHVHRILALSVRSII